MDNNDALLVLRRLREIVYDHVKFMKENGIEFVEEED